jgi:hypothetical protein
MTNRWKTTAIGTAGYDAADSLAPVIAAWLAEYGEPEVSPEDLALIAREVVRQLALERNLYQKYSAHVVADKIRRRARP